MPIRVSIVRSVGGGGVRMSGMMVLLDVRYILEVRAHAVAHKDKAGRTECVMPQGSPVTTGVSLLLIRVLLLHCCGYFTSAADVVVLVIII